MTGEEPGPGGLASASPSRVSLAYEESWSGPLPPARELRSYDGLVAGGAERIFRQFEAEAEHRRGLDSFALAEDAAERRRAQWAAGLFAFGALAVGAFALHLGAHGVAAIVLGTTLVGVIGAFLYREARSG
ncbi:hypothetical protein GCM10008171_12530 [Methylopila jiangsuensis]|uniref:DUF2335 domain-containing protein n=1 Tax=Methylopila jiangsuensis TaxID=586230 RepID=A0A9W6N2I3_9HYPH|nr:DUF2335 domain-containing protein [Methylopila jiangsuensis]MDR6286238.1 putative membrane protein [Methylopila jiangsuensis]GLK75999.1 hypothetical protein GCM10008171_12530 [Methylopila jiangsuensis]